MTTASPKPTATVASVSGYQYVGCYQDSEGRTRGSDRVLGNASYTDDNLKIATCQWYCEYGAAGAPYPYFGVEDGSECWCGSKLNSNSQNTKFPEDECRVECNSRSGEICGAPWRINVWSATTTVTPRYSFTSTIASSTANSTLSVSRTSSIGPASTSPTAELRPSSSAATDSGVSSSTIAAAVLAGIFGLALLLIGLFFLLHRRKQAKRDAEEATKEDDLVYDPEATHNAQSFGAPDAAGVPVRVGAAAH